MGAGVARQCSRNRCLAPADTSDFRRDREAQLAERTRKDPVTGPIRVSVPFRHSGGWLGDLPSLSGAVAADAPAGAALWRPAPWPIAAAEPALGSRSKELPERERMESLRLIA